MFTETLPTILKEVELDSKILTQMKLGGNSRCNGNTRCVIHTIKILHCSSVYQMRNYVSKNNRKSQLQKKIGIYFFSKRLKLYKQLDYSQNQFLKKRSRSFITSKRCVSIPYSKKNTGNCQNPTLWEKILNSPIFAEMQQSKMISIASQPSVVLILSKLLRSLEYLLLLGTRWPAC